MLAAIDEGVPAHVLARALYERFSSRGEADYADKLLSAMRKQFGGHVASHGRRHPSPTAPIQAGARAGPSLATAARSDS